MIKPNISTANGFLNIIVELDRKTANSFISTPFKVRLNSTTHQVNRHYTKGRLNSMIENSDIKSKILTVHSDIMQEQSGFDSVTKRLLVLYYSFVENLP